MGKSANSNGEFISCNTPHVNNAPCLLGSLCVKSLSPSIPVTAQWMACGTSGPVGAPAPRPAPTGPPSARGSATGPPTGGPSATEAGWRQWTASLATVQVTRERGEDRSALRIPRKIDFKNAHQQPFIVFWRGGAGYLVVKNIALLLLLLYELTCIASNLYIHDLSSQHTASGYSGWKMAAVDLVDRLF